MPVHPEPTRRCEGSGDPWAFLAWSTCTSTKPQGLLEKVRAYFDARGPLVGRDWPIEYRWPQDRRLEHLRALGVRAFPTLLYAHKP